MKKMILLMAAVSWLSAAAADYDLNGDGAVTQADCEMISTCILNGTASAQCDIDSDGKVDVADLHALSTYVQTGVMPHVRVVPQGKSSVPKVSIPDITISAADIGRKIEIPFTLTMPEGDNFTNIQLHIVFPEGLKPYYDEEYECYGYAGSGIKRKAGAPVVSFSDNFANEEYYPEYDLIGANTSKTPNTANPNEFYVLNVTPQASFTAGTRHFNIWLKYVREDDTAYAFGTAVGGATPGSTVYTELYQIENNITFINPYDLNGDGAVTRADYTLLVTRIADGAVYNSQFDLDGNGTVDVLDANLLLEELDTQPLSTQTYTVNGVSFTMVAVEGGTFTMGATAEQGSDYDNDELPTHQVTLSSYSIGQTEVTQALWQAVMGSNPSRFNGGSYGTNMQRPVEQVSWNDCREFITKLNQLTGQQFRLPTEAEWEYAARGGNKSKGYKYAGSNTVGDVAWSWDNIPSQSNGTSGYGTQTVGTKQANELGLYDMSGNVLEWCQDWYGSYSSGAQTNPTGPSSGSLLVSRGGDWNSSARDCRVSSRSNYRPPTSRHIIVGLRLVQ